MTPSHRTASHVAEIWHGKFNQPDRMRDFIEMLTSIEISVDSWDPPNLHSRSCAPNLQFEPFQVEFNLENTSRLTSCFVWSSRVVPTGAEMVGFTFIFNLNSTWKYRRIGRFGSICQGDTPFVIFMNHLLLLNNFFNLRSILLFFRKLRLSLDAPPVGTLFKLNSSWKTSSPRDWVTSNRAGRNPSVKSNPSNSRLLQISTSTCHVSIYFKLNSTWENSGSTSQPRFP